MTQSYYSIALCFYKAKSKEETEHIKEDDCRKALNYLMLDPQFRITPLSNTAYRLAFRTGKSVCFSSAGQVLRYLATFHKGSICWHPQASFFEVTRIAKRLVSQAGFNSNDLANYLDAAAKRYVAQYFRHPEVQAMI